MLYDVSDLDGINASHFFDCISHIMHVKNLTFYCEPV